MVMEVPHLAHFLIATSANAFTSLIYSINKMQASDKGGVIQQAVTAVVYLRHVADFFENFHYLRVYL